MPWWSPTMDSNIQVTHDYCPVLVHHMLLCSHTCNLRATIWLGWALVLSVLSLSRLDINLAWIRQVWAMAIALSLLAFTLGFLTGEKKQKDPIHKVMNYGGWHFKAAGSWLKDYLVHCSWAVSHWMAESLPIKHIAQIKQRKLFLLIYGRRSAGRAKKSMLFAVLRAANCCDYKLGLVPIKQPSYNESKAVIQTNS